MVKQPDTTVQHTRVHHIFLNLGLRQVNASLAPVVEESHGSLVCLVMTAYPAPQPDLVAPGTQGFYFGLILTRETVNGNKGVHAGSSTATAHHIDATAVGHLLIAAVTHYATINQLTRRNAQLVSVILHLALLISKPWRSSVLTESHSQAPCCSASVAHP